MSEITYGLNRDKSNESEWKKYKLVLTISSQHESEYFVGLIKGALIASNIGVHGFKVVEVPATEPR